MGVSYNRLWKLLIDKEMGKMEFMEKCKLSSGIMQNLRENKAIHLKAIERICEELDCNIEDIAEIMKDNNRRNIIEEKDV